MTALNTLVDGQRAYAGPVNDNFVALRDVADACAAALAAASPTGGANTLLKTNGAGGFSVVGSITANGIVSGGGAAITGSLAQTHAAGATVQIGSPVSLSSSLTTYGGILVGQGIDVTASVSQHHVAGATVQIGSPATFGQSLAVAGLLAANGGIGGIAAGRVLVGSGGSAAEAVAGAADGQLLTWNGATNRWEARALGGVFNATMLADLALRPNPTYPLTVTMAPGIYPFLDTSGATPYGSVANFSAGVAPIPLTLNGLSPGQERYAAIFVNRASQPDVAYGAVAPTGTAIFPLPNAGSALLGWVKLTGTMTNATVLTFADLYRVPVGLGLLPTAPGTGTSGGGGTGGGASFPVVIGDDPARADDTDLALLLRGGYLGGGGTVNGVDRASIVTHPRMVRTAPADASLDDVLARYISPAIMGDGMVVDNGSGGVALLASTAKPIAIKALGKQRWLTNQVYSNSLAGVGAGTAYVLADLNGAGPGFTLTVTLAAYYNPANADGNGQVLLCAAWWDGTRLQLSRTGGAYVDWSYISPTYRPVVTFDQAASSNSSSAPLTHGTTWAAVTQMPVATLYTPVPLRMRTRFDVDFIQASPAQTFGFAYSVDGIVTGPGPTPLVGPTPLYSTGPAGLRQAFTHGDTFTVSPGAHALRLFAFNATATAQPSFTSIYASIEGTAP